jgi:hypothetical protein
MSATAVMVDRMNYVRSRPAVDGEGVVVLVDGEAFDERVEGPIFKCRLSSPTTRERMQDQSFSYERDMTAIVNIKALTGEAFDFLASDKITVESAAFGTVIYEMLGEPTVVRSVKKVILYEMALRKYSHR